MSMAMTLSGAIGWRAAEGRKTRAIAAGRVAEGQQARAIAAGRAFGAILALMLIVSRIVVAPAPLFAEGIEEIEDIQGIDGARILELTDAVEIGRLDNGLTYYLQANENPREVIDLRLIVKTGSAHEEEHERGLAHFVEHMGFNGTERYPGNEIISQMELLGAKFGPDINAFTSFDQTVYTLQLTASEPDSLETGLTILQQWAFAMEMERAEIRKERGVVLEEMRLRQDGGQRIFDQHLTALFEGTRYADRLPIGRAEVVRGASPQDIREFYRRWYLPHRMALVIVGDIEPPEIRTAIERIFSAEDTEATREDDAENDAIEDAIEDAADDATEGRASRDDDSERALATFAPHSDLRISIAYDPEITREQAILYLTRPPVDEDTVAEYRHSLRFALLSIILNQRFGDLSDSPASALRGARLSLGFWQLNHALEAATLAIQFDAQRSLEAIRITLEEIARFAQFGPDEQEYEQAKRQLLRLYEQYRAEYPTQHSQFFSAAYTRHFLYGELLLDVEEEERLARELIDTIDPATLVEDAALLLHGANQVFTYTGIGEATAEPEAAAARVSADDIATLFAAAQSMRVADRRQQEEQAAFVIDPQSLRPRQPSDYHHDTELGLHRWRFANGIEVVLRENDYNQDVIDFDLYSRGGASLYDDDEYFDTITAADIIAASGVGQLTPAALRRYLSDKQIAVAPYIREFTEGMRGNFSMSDSDAFGQLLHAYFAAPRLDMTQFQNWQRRTIERIEERENDPLARMELRQQELLTAGHPRTLPLTADAARSIDPQRAYRIYRERFAESGAGDFTLVFVGNIAPQQLEAVLERYVATLPAISVASENAAVSEDSPAREQWRPYAITYPSRALTEQLSAGIGTRGIASLLYFGDYRWSLTENAALFALSNHLDTLLNERIRERLSSVYSIQADAASMRVPSDRFIFQIFFGGDPDRLTEIVGQVEEVVAAARSTPPTEEQMERIKETQRSQFLRDSQTNGYWINLLRFSDLYEFGMREALDRLARIDALTPRDIQDTATRYLNDDRRITLTLVPAQ